MSFDPQRILNSLSSSSEIGCPVGDVALAFASLLHGGHVPELYVNFLKKVAKDVIARFDDLHETALGDGMIEESAIASMKLAALKHIISDKYGFVADDSAHEPCESADFLRVIDRASGHSVALVVLYMHVAQEQGWILDGLKIHDRFLCRLEHAGVRIIFDPARQCKVMEAHDLRGMAKDALGDDAELAHECFVGIGTRVMIVHLMNMIKRRHIEMGDYDLALNISEYLCALAPQEYSLFLDAGILYARCKDTPNAVRCLEVYIAHTPKGGDRYEAQKLLHELKAE